MPSNNSIYLICYYTNPWLCLQLLTQFSWTIYSEQALNWLYNNIILFYLFHSHLYWTILSCITEIQFKLEINNTVFLNQDDNTSSWYYLYNDIYLSYIQMYNYSLLPITILGLRCYILFHYYISSLFDLDQHSTGIILLPSNQNLFLIYTIYSLILVIFSSHINQTMHRKIKNYQELFHSHIRNQRPLSLDLIQFMHCSSLIILQY